MCDLVNGHHVSSDETSWKFAVSKRFEAKNNRPDHNKFENPTAHTPKRRQRHGNLNNPQFLEHLDRIEGFRGVDHEDP